MTTQSKGAVPPIVYTFDSTGLRALVEEDGSEWFSAAEVCTLLGYANPRDAVATHCREDGVAKRDITDRLGRPQEMTFINEGNLWRLIIKSRKPQAQAFERQVMEVILPAIRQTGHYAVPSKQAPAKRLPAAVLQRLAPPSLSADMRRAINRKAHALSLDGFDRTRDRLAEIVTVWLERQWTEQDVIEELQKLGGVLGEYHLVHADDLWPVTSRAMLLRDGLNLVADAVVELEKATGRAWFVHGPDVGVPR